MLYRSLFLCLTLVSVLGCSAMGVPATSDPYQKLAYANQMIDQGRSVAAQKFMSEALQTFQENGDDFGAAEAYHDYGNFYKNRNIGIQNYEKSEESFRKAFELYEKKTNYMGMMKSYFGIGNTYHSRKDYPKACEAYEKSKGYYLKGMEVNPNENMQLNPNFKNPGDMIDGFMKSINCDQMQKKS